MLEKLKYKDQPFPLCGDYKVQFMLAGHQRGFVKYFCLICLWDSRARTEHYKRKDWPPRTERVIGKHNVANTPLVDINLMIPAFLHLKLGLGKQFLQKLDPNGPAFKRAQELLHISDAKMKAGVVTGPQLRILFADATFESLLNKKEKRAWLAVQGVCTGLLGNHRAADYKERCKELIASFEKLGCNMSLKVHILNAHLDTFPVNCGAVSDEQGERTHQTMKKLVKAYKNKNHGNYEHLLADSVWMDFKEEPNAAHARAK